MGCMGSKERRLKKVGKEIKATEKEKRKVFLELIKDVQFPDGEGGQIGEKDHELFRKHSTLETKLKDLRSEENRINKEEEQIPGVGYEKGSSSIVGDIKQLWSKSRKSDS